MDTCDENKTNMEDDGIDDYYIDFPFDYYTAYPFSEKTVAYLKSILKGDTSNKALTWDCDYRRAALIKCGHTLTPEQNKLIQSDYVNLDPARYFAVPPSWWHEDGQIFSIDNSGKYPNMAEYVDAWYDTAQKYPFLDIIFLSLANNEINLRWEWDLMIEKVKRMPKEEVDEMVLLVFCGLAGYGYIKEGIAVPATFNLEEFMEKHRQAGTMAPENPTDMEERIVESIAFHLTFWDAENFGLEKFMYEPERLRKYMDIGLHMKDGRLIVISDPDEMLKLLAERLPKNKILPERNNR